MTLIDWLMISAYFGVLAVVVVATRRRQETSQDFFLGGRTVGWLAIGASIFAANIGSEHECCLKFSLPFKEFSLQRIGCVKKTVTV